MRTLKDNVSGVAAATLVIGGLCTALSSNLKNLENLFPVQLGFGGGAFGAALAGERCKLSPPKQPSQIATNPVAAQAPGVSNSLQELQMPAPPAAGR